MAVREPFNFKSLEELKMKASLLGAEVHFSDDLSSLAQPLRLKGRNVPNRLAVLPMEGRDATADGKPTALTFRRYERYARGGAGLIWLEAVAIHPMSKSTDRQLCLTSENRGDLARLLNAMRDAAADELGHIPLCILQLHDAGRYRKAKNTKPALVVSNPYLDPRVGIPPDAPLLSDGEIEAMEGLYVDAASLAQEAGFDGVDVKSCHRYLVSDMLSAFLRKGPYGGSFEGRTRFLLNVVKKIRIAVGDDFLLAVRLNLYDGIPHPHGWGVDREDPRIPDLTEPLELVRRLKGAGVDLICASSGTPYYNPHVGRPYERPPAGALSPDEHPLEGVSRALSLVERLQTHLPDLPVVGFAYTWLRNYAPFAAASNISRGAVSLAGFGRMVFAYPDFARDILEKGHLDEKKVCICCSLCSEAMAQGRNTGCFVRDRNVYTMRR